MASLSTLTGVTYGVSNIAPLDTVLPNFTQPDNTVALGGQISVPDPGFGFFSDNDQSSNDSLTVTNVNLTAATSYRFGILTALDNGTGTMISFDIIGLSPTQVLLGVTAPDPADPTNPMGNFYTDGYYILSNTDLDLLETNSTPPQFPLNFSGAASAANIYTPPCFASGTRIATPSGFALVEEIKSGDVVVTLTGEHETVTWTGLRHVEIARHPNPDLVRPIRINAGAFADNQPTRDLFVSPDHNLFVGGVLIPAKCLVNGVSVAQIDVPSVTYHHVELAAHDVVLAEGLPAETYLDTGNRNSFAGQGVTVAHPDFASAPDVNFFAWESKGYARLVLEGPEVVRARNQIAARIELVAQDVNVRAA